MLYHIHPVAELFKLEFSKHLEEIRQQTDEQKQPNFYVIWYNRMLFPEHFEDDGESENSDGYFTVVDDDDFRVCGVCAAILFDPNANHCFTCHLSDIFHGHNYLTH